MVKAVYDEGDQINCIELDGSEHVDAVVDACLEHGAVHSCFDRLHVRLPGWDREYLTRAELKRKLEERRA